MQRAVVVVLVVVAVAACGPTAEGSDRLVTVEVDGSMDALTRGRLTQDGRCTVMAEDLDGRTDRYLVVWPEGARLVEAPSPHVVREGRADVPVDGTPVELGGGFLAEDDAAAVERIGSAPLTACSERTGLTSVWLAA